MKRSTSLSALRLSALTLTLVLAMMTALSAAVTRRIADQLGALRFDRIYGNFNNVIAEDAATVVERSAQRHIGWVRGDFDHLT